MNFIKLTFMVWFDPGFDFRRKMIRENKLCVFNVYYVVNNKVLIHLLNLQREKIS